MGDTMIEVLKSGGIIMIPIALCGAASVFILIERLYFFVSVKRSEKSFSPDIEALLAAGDFDAAESFCSAQDIPCAKAVQAAVQNRNLEESALKDIVQVKLDCAAAECRRFLPELSTLSSVSTLLGLLGTVTGNIRAFGILGDGGALGNPSLLAGAIAESLVTTAAGLSVAIPSAVFFQVFESQADKRILFMEQTVTSALASIAGKPRGLRRELRE